MKIARATSLLLLLLAFTLSGCQLVRESQSGPGSFEAKFPNVLDAYRDMPEHKALFLAKDTDDRWAYGYGNGYATREQAIERARKECQTSRKSYDVQSSCQPYAIDDKFQ